MATSVNLYTKPQPPPFEPTSYIQYAEDQFRAIERAFHDSITGSLSGSGYIKLGNGLIIQWGTASPGGTSSASITFPIAFTTAVYALNANIIQNAPGTNTIESVMFGSVSTTGCLGYPRYNNGVSTAVASESFYWIAIGK